MTNGPVLMGPSVEMLELSTVVSMMVNRGSASLFGIIGSGFSVLMVSVCPSAVISEGVKYSGPLCPFSNTFSIEAFARSAVSFVPLEKVTLSRMVKVHSV